MTTILAADQYMILMAITILFTILAIVRQSVTLNALSFVCWVFAAISHLLGGAVASPLTLALTWLYFGLAMIFLVLTFASLMKVFEDVERKRWEAPL